MLRVEGTYIPIRNVSYLNAATVEGDPLPPDRTAGFVTAIIGAIAMVGGIGADATPISWAVW